MNDQNNDNLSSQPSATKNGNSAIAIAITSGKGGVGKTNISTNLGIALAKSGSNVCVFDADTSLANINILLGLTPEHTLEHYLEGSLTIDDIIIDGPEHLKIIPSATGIAEYANLNPEKQAKLTSALEMLEQSFDYILIDTAAGISESVINFIQSAEYAIVVITPEPTSLTDAFSLIKVLKRRNYEQPIYVLVNMTNNYKHSMDVFKRFAHAVNKYVQLKVRYLGYIPMDKAVRDAIAVQTPITVSDPESPAGRCIFLLANILLKHFKTGSAPVRKISQFWREQYENSSFTEETEVDVNLQPVSADDRTITNEVPSKNKSHEATSLESKEPLFVEDISAAIETNPEQTPARLSLEESDPYHLMSRMIADQNISQDQTDSLLAQLITFYLTQFGALPKQAIDLVLQAHDQGELSDQSLSRISTQLIDRENISSTEKTSSIDRSETATASVEHMYSQLDNLVSDAERTKKELTDLASHIRQKYRDLYNYDLAKPQSSVHTLRSTSKSAVQTEQCSEDDSLRQSIQFASAVDRRNSEK